MTKDEMIKRIEKEQERLTFTLNRLKLTEKYDFVQMFQLRKVIDNLSKVMSSPIQYPESELEPESEPESEKLELDDMSTDLQLIQKRIKDFEDVQRKYANDGAMDSEPDYHFHRAIVDAWNREDYVDRTPGEWELYSNSNSEYVAQKLNEAMAKLAEIIIKVSKTGNKEVRVYLEDYTDRVAEALDRNRS